ncbi:MAG: tetratricopeptide repeat protein [Xanthomonadales bacterium]|nr:tetratricopeptide repeat protein [Xanthomonadales bacterium]
MSFFEELKRRNVFRVGAAYAVAGWLLMQITDVFAPALHLPEWFPTAVAFLLIIGFPITLFFAWAFELTPDGIKRESEVARDASITHQTAARLDRVTIGLLVLVAGMILVDRLMPEKEMGSEPFSPASGSLVEEPEPEENRALTPPDGRTSVAVLPFVNMSDDAQNEYFSDGISEELLNVLVKIESLRVPSRTSSFTFKGSQQTLSEIGQALNVDHILEGSVRKAGNQIRVTAQLIDVDTDTHLWSDTYTRELDDIFAVQDEISQAIVQALQVTLSGDDQQDLEYRSTQNADAYNLYLLGRHWWNQRIPGRMSEALEPLQQAVELDPEFDQAWAALADVYLLLPEYAEGTVEEHIPNASSAAARALTINPDSARALTTQAYIKAMYHYDWQGAEQDFLRAIEMEPDYATARQWYAEALAAQRRIDESLAQLEVARQIDPLAPIIPHIQGWVCAWDDRLEEAQGYYEEALRLDPGFPYSISNLAIVHARMGEYETAREYWIRYGQVTGDVAHVRPFTVLVDAMEDPALEPLAIEALSAPAIGIDPFTAPASFAMLGRLNLALEAILKNYKQGGPYAVHVNRMKIFDPLREDPRFMAMLREMNLAD